MAYIASLGTDDRTPALNAWRKATFTAACEAYRLACGQETPRQMRAFAKGWQRLVTRKKEGEPEEPKSKEEEAV